MTTNTNTPMIGLLSHQGKRGEENDDHAAWFSIARSDRKQFIHIGVVADGVTSTAGGAQASRIATEAIEATLRDLPDSRETITEWLATAVRSANEEILFEGKRNPAWQGMSTTVVLAALAGDRLYVLHLGDSRAYLYRENRLYQLTTDHTWAQAAVASGILSKAEAANHPGRNQLQRYLGGKQIQIAHGVLDPQTGYAEEYLLVQPGDRILLCSDGIYHRVAEERILNIIEQEQRPQTVVESLVQAALDRGEIDDITALFFVVPQQTTGEVFSAPQSTADDEATVFLKQA